MADLFSQYGIKEVADVTIYEIKTDGSEAPYLFLDSLKVFTAEQTAEQAEARGGKGNSPLIIWDFGKEINITCTDALYSPRSMALAWGTTSVSDSLGGTITKVFNYTPTTDETVTTSTAKEYHGATYVGAFQEASGATVTSLIKGKTYMFIGTTTASNSSTIHLSADSFPDVYKVVGDTYARNRNTGKDEYFRITINRAKILPEQTLDLQAEGDPATFNFNMRALRPTSGDMITLTQYSFN